MIVYIDGAYLPGEEAKIPISDRGFQFGDGAFATLRVEEGRALFLESHLLLLEEQCNSFGLIPPKVTPIMIQELIRLNHAEKGVWRLKILVTGGDIPEMRLPSRQGRLVIFLKPFQPVKHTLLKLGIFSIPFYLCHASFKSLAHLNRYYVMEEAFRLGVDDCVTLTENRIVLEAAFGNLFWIEDHTLFTPTPALPIYFGITIREVVKIAESLGYSIEKVKIRLEDLPESAHYFRTNTMGEIMPIRQIGRDEFPYDEELDRLFFEEYRKAAGLQAAASMI